MTEAAEPDVLSQFVFKRSRFQPVCRRLRIEARNGAGGHKRTAA